jgi:phenylacetate-CoA ligase
VFPSEIEAVVLDDPALGAQYAIVVDRRETLLQLEIRTELSSPEFVQFRHEVADRLHRRLAERLRLRVTVVVEDPGGIPRQELGKARRVFERTAEVDPFPRS